MSARKLVADKLLWETLERWKRSSPELDRIKFLKTVAFFNELSDRQLKTVSSILFERKYEPEELIFEEGQPGAALFLILDGTVAVEMRRKNQTTTLAILERGAFFGEMALLGSRLIKSTIPGRLQDRRTPSSFGPTYRIVWRCA
jgi:CRP-like cAMP-binding protein